jgi:hypothetical protein
MGFRNVTACILEVTNVSETGAAMFKVKLLPSNWRYDTV